MRYCPQCLVDNRWTPLKKGEFVCNVCNVKWESDKKKKKEVK